MFKAYYTLTKPGIIYGNLVNTAAGFFLACSVSRTFDAWLGVAILAGVALVIASACVYNNYIDRNVDTRMARTKTRALVTGEISAVNALVFATVLGIAGFVIIAAFTNMLTVMLGVIAFVVYIAIYGWAKRHSTWGTIVGSVAGALPPVAGYCAVTNELDAGAVILFLILVFWQMPHFYAIAMYRHDDYKAASIPVLPVVKGMQRAKLSTLLYIVAFMLSVAALTLYGYTGYIFMGLMVALGIAWLVQGVRFKPKDDKVWGRKMFLFSLKVIMALAVLLSVGALLP